MFTTYVLYSRKYDKIYVGFTSNLDERMTSHNELAKKGWSVRYRPWEVIHREEFNTKAAAMKREKELKSAKGREWIWQKIKGG